MNALLGKLLWWRHRQNIDITLGCPMNGNNIYTTDYEYDYGAVNSDSALTKTEDDKLGRVAEARTIANCIMKLDARNGFVFGLQGPWGSGKTTLANFIRSELENWSHCQPPIVMFFNPWWFSSRDELLVCFLQSLSDAIGRSDPSRGLSSIAAKVGLLGNILKPLTYVPGLRSCVKDVADASKEMAKAIKDAAEQCRLDVDRIQSEIRRELEQKSTRIVVFVDDLDRLDGAELKQMFAIIKAVANFPNVIYVLMFDRQRAENTLQVTNEQDASGYLEKVIQTSLDLPPLTPRQFHELLQNRLFGIVQVESETDDWNRLLSFYLNVLLPALKTPREVNRYVNALALTYPGLAGEVNPVDFLAMEFIRLFAPAVYRHIQDNKPLYAGITDNKDMDELADNDKRKVLYEECMKILPAQMAQLVLIAMKMLFPKVSVCYDRMNYGHSWSAIWYREKRCCNPNIWPLYFSFTPPAGYFGEADYQKLLLTTGDANTFRKALEQLADEAYITGYETRLGAALDALHDHDADGFKPLDSYEALLALADMIDNVPEDADPENMGFVNNKKRIEWLINQILRKHPKPGDLFVRVTEATTSVHVIVACLSIYEELCQALRDNKCSPDDIVLNESEIQRVKPVVLTRIHEIADNGILKAHHELVSILYRWQDWEKEAEEAFVNGLLETDDGLIIFLTRALRDIANQEHRMMRNTMMARAMDSISTLVDINYLKTRAREVLESGVKIDSAVRDTLILMAEWDTKISVASDENIDADEVDEPE